MSGKTERASDLAMRPKHGLAVTSIDGQAMVYSELVEALHDQYKAAMRQLTRAIEREGFIVLVDHEGRLQLARKQ